MKIFMNKDEIVNHLVANGYGICDYEDTIDIGKHTPLGEDWWEMFDWKSSQAFYEELKRRVENFDIDEEVDIWVGSRGENGVPSSISALIEDAKWKKEQLENLLKELK